ncbi:MAG: site-specific integrase, partial [Firmicutes bacterium]|nr:site-specific integrase [Bacillota bacterium]
MAKTVMRSRLGPRPCPAAGTKTHEGPGCGDASRRPQKTWQEALSDFLLMKQAHGLRERTLRDYRKNVTLFFRKFPNAFESEEKLLSSVYEYLGQKLKPASYNLYLIYLKAYFNYCVQRGIIRENPLNGFKTKQAESRIVDISPQDLRRLVDVFDLGIYTGLRDYSLFLLQINTGIRPGEALKLLPEHFRLDSGVVIVPAEISKTKRERILPIDTRPVLSIKQLLSVRPPDWGSNSPVFSGWNGEILSEGAWCHRPMRYGRAIGLDIRPYDLRHFFAITFLRQGGNIYDLQAIMGHTT